MKRLNSADVYKYVEEKFIKFYQAEVEALKEITLSSILRDKNPYFLAFNDISIVGDLVQDTINHFLLPIEEELFGNFLEELAIFISSKTCNGRKSAATGIDFEFEDDGKHYLVSVKSGPNWGNKSQQDKQEHDFKTAVKVLKQSRRTLNVEPVLGICYGKVRTTHLRGYLKVVGQNFWYLISEDENLYIDIIEPLGYRAKQHNAKFMKQKSKIINLFTHEFLVDFCDDGIINWKKLVEFNSGNLDLKITKKKIEK